MPKYIYSTKNGAVYTRNPKVKLHEKMRVMTDVECKVYDKWIVATKKAIAEGTPLPKQPVFPMTDVVADIEPEEVVIETQPIAAEKQPAVEEALFEEG
jgi:hypothetical protein